MENITILYYSSNRETPEFEKKIIDNLLKTCGNLPIISVSQKPLDLGHNICIGDKGCSYLNEYRQILIGAKEATTKYVIFAESDFLYPKDYFNFKPTKDVYLYDNIWIAFRDRKHYRRKPYSEGAQICRRELLIEKYEKFLKGHPDWFDGRIRFRKIEPFWKYPRERFTGLPCVSFKTRNGVSPNTSVLEEKISTLPHWGSLRELNKEYYKL